VEKFSLARNYHPLVGCGWIQNTSDQTVWLYIGYTGLPGARHLGWDGVVDRQTPAPLHAHFNVLGRYYCACLRGGGVKNLLRPGLFPVRGVLSTIRPWLIADRPWKFGPDQSTAVWVILHTDLDSLNKRTVIASYIFLRCRSNCSAHGFL